MKVCCKSHTAYRKDKNENVSFYESSLHCATLRLTKLWLNNKDNWYDSYLFEFDIFAIIWAQLGLRLLLSFLTSKKTFLKYLGSWRHLSVKIFRSRYIVKTFRDETYIYMEAIYQISAQSDTWTITAQEGEVLAPFT